eukprot:TRINITY_DN9881_c0_g1_i1.p1 TRINITY_DN9881_c0_g1~~TRINITY_DN9881_c0_g1_i1.p1  ORF type:complete len:807 (+),score=156.65 TRINITY_DN9881_c0_g1_i1:45-2465(+)
MGGDRIDAQQIPSSADDKAVVARNFPANWLTPEALASLAEKVCQLLGKFGEIDGSAIVSQGPTGLEAVVHFKEMVSARDAVSNLHGFDLRSKKLKKTCQFAAPKDSERFWLQPLSAASNTHLGDSAAQVKAAPSAVVVVQDSKPQLLSVRLSPLPRSWTINDVLDLISPYGSVLQVCLEELVGNGHLGATARFSAEGALHRAIQSLDGLSLMGVRLSCQQQQQQQQKQADQPEGEGTIVQAVYIDELFGKNPSGAAPRLDDRELYIAGLPKALHALNKARLWLQGLGEVDQLFLLKDCDGKPTGNAYARFCNHAAAAAALPLIEAQAHDRQMRVRWSESERWMHGAKGSYGIEVLSMLSGQNNEGLEKIRTESGVATLEVASGHSDISFLHGGPQLHFIMKAQKQENITRCRMALSTQVSNLHKVFAETISNSLVIKNFATSWTETQLKFILAPYGGFSSVLFSRESDSTGLGDGKSVRVAHVSMKDSMLIDKAALTLHDTMVGDGDLVEPCVILCSRRPVSGWSDGSFPAVLFLDEVPMPRSPCRYTPTPRDRELFFRNLPLRQMSQEQLREYFEGFGRVSDVYLLRDNWSGKPTGDGYVRFVEHRGAQDCLAALAKNEDTQPTDLCCWWSESERLLQRTSSVYEVDLLEQILSSDGSWLQAVQQACALKGIWFLGQGVKHISPKVPKALAKQAHFYAVCQHEASVIELRKLLASALEKAHRRIQQRIGGQPADGDTNLIAAQPLPATVFEATPSGQEQGPDGESSSASESGVKAKKHKKQKKKPKKAGAEKKRKQELRILLLLP